MDRQGEIISKEAFEKTFEKNIPKNLTLRFKAIIGKVTDVKLTNDFMEFKAEVFDGKTIEAISKKSLKGIGISGRIIKSHLNDDKKRVIEDFEFHSIALTEYPLFPEHKIEIIDED